MHTCASLRACLQYTMYPQSLYENIVRGAALGVPMYITEIGCADKSSDDHIRLANIESSIHQVRRKRMFCLDGLAAATWQRPSKAARGHTCMRVVHCNSLRGSALTAKLHGRCDAYMLFTVAARSFSRVLPPQTHNARTLCR